MAESEPTMRCFLIGLGRAPAKPLAFIFCDLFPFKMPFVYVESAGGGTPLIPSSRSRFFPLSESELVFVGAETATDGCDWRFKDGAVDEGLELDLGTAELGRGTAEEG